MSEQRLSRTRYVNTALLEQAMIHLFAAYGERTNLDKIRAQPLDILTVMISTLKIQGYTLSDIQHCWDEMSEKES